MREEEGSRRASSDSVKALRGSGQTFLMEGRGLIIGMCFFSRREC